MSTQWKLRCLVGLGSGAPFSRSEEGVFQTFFEVWQRDRQVPTNTGHQATEQNQSTMTLPGHPPLRSDGRTLLRWQPTARARDSLILYFTGVATISFIA